MSKVTRLYVRKENVMSYLGFTQQRNDKVIVLILKGLFELEEIKVKQVTNYEQ